MHGTTEWIWISQLLFCCTQKTLQEPLGSLVGSFPMLHDPYDHPPVPLLLISLLFKRHTSIGAAWPKVVL